LFYFRDKEFLPPWQSQFQVGHAPGMACGMRGIPHLKLVGPRFGEAGRAGRCFAAP